MKRRWITWAGGVQPVADMTQVQVVLGKYHPEIDRGLAYTFEWGWTDFLIHADCELVAFRLVDIS